MSMTSLPTQERVLRLERALAAAVSQERYTDAASLRDALEAVRTADPVLAKRAELQTAVEMEDFLTAARVRDELAALTERFSRADAGRRVDRIIVLRGRGDPDNALRVATVSREGDVQLGLVPEPLNKKNDPPRVYLQPTWSPSGDFVAMTEISFTIDLQRLGRGLAIADSSSRLVIMNAFDGSVVKSAPLVKPPFFYFWSPDGRCVTLLSNDPTAPVTTVALSVMQVVAPPGGGGLDLDTVTGPLASGHPFLYDFCPRDSSRIIAHMGDKSTVTLVPVSPYHRGHKLLSSNAGAFGAPQWHPNPGINGREVVLYVEQDLSGDAAEKLFADLRDKTGEISIMSADQLSRVDGAKKDGADTDDDDKLPFEKFISNGTTLLESVLRRGAESLGLAPKADDENSSTEKDGKDEDAKSESENDFREGIRRLLPKKPSSIRDEQWGESLVAEQIASRLVMADADEPELKRTLARFTGVMAFKLSPDGEALATLVTSPGTGQDELTICTGDFSPDSVVEKADVVTRSSSRSITSEADIILSTPYTRVLAFFWSPDSKKLLFLTAMRGSSVGAAQWATFDIDSNKVVRYEKFVVSGIYMHCLNFFDQFASSMTPWSPDSDAFCYPGRPLTQEELERDQSQSGESSTSLSGLFMQRDGTSDGKRFSARVQKVPRTIDGILDPEDALTIVENVEYACWSPC